MGVLISETCENDDVKTKIVTPDLKK